MTPSNFSPAPPPLPSSRPPASGTEAGSGLRVLFQVYLLALLFDGAIGVTAATTRLGLGSAPYFTGFVCISLAMVLALAACSYRHFPWRLALPGMLLNFWAGFLFLPLPAFVPWRHIQLGYGLLELGVVAAAAPALLAGGLSAFSKCVFSWRRTFVSLAIKLFILLPALLAYTVLSGVWMVEHLSRGFLQIRKDGIYTETRTYERGGKQVHLLPTVHIASPDFYRALLAELPTEHTVLLTEGVTDTKGLLKSKIDYSGPARSAGLVAQPALESEKHLPAVSCDADMSDFSPSTIQFLNIVGRALSLWKQGTGTAVMLDMSGFEEVGDPDWETLLHDILIKRNERLMAGIETALKDYDVAAVPWGVAHMPDLERRLIQNQMHQTASRRVRLVDWSPAALAQ